MSSMQVTLGSRGNWVGIRLTEAVVFFVAAPALYILNPQSGVELAAAIIALLAVAAVWDPVAWGTADETGVRYRHYFGRHFVPWEAVSRVDWSSAWIVVVRKEGWLLRRRIVFPLQRSIKDALAEAVGRPLPEPPAVAALKELVPAAQLDLRSIQRARPKHAMVALAVFLSLAVGIAWAWWALLRP